MALPVLPPFMGDAMRRVRRLSSLPFDCLYICVSMRVCGAACPWSAVYYAGQGTEGVDSGVCFCSKL